MSFQILEVIEEKNYTQKENIFLEKIEKSTLNYISTGTIKLR